MLKKTLAIAKMGPIIFLIGFLLISGIGCGDNGPLTIGKLKAKGNSMYDQEIRLNGKIVKDSIDLDAQNEIMRFILTDGHDSLNVVYQDQVKVLEMLVPDVNLILVGRYNATGIFNVEAVDQEKTPYCQTCH